MGDIANDDQISSYNRDRIYDHNCYQCNKQFVLEPAVSPHQQRIEKTGYGDYYCRQVKGKTADTSDI